MSRQKNEDSIFLEPALSRREREILDVLYQRSSASARDVQKCLRGSPSYSTVRALLSAMERKGHVGHRIEGRMYVYCASASIQQARRIAIERLVKTYFAGSVERALAALRKHGKTFS